MFLREIFRFSGYATTVAVIPLLTLSAFLTVPNPPQVSLDQGRMSITVTITRPEGGVDSYIIRCNGPRCQREMVCQEFCGWSLCQTSLDLIVPVSTKSHLCDVLVATWLHIDTAALFRVVFEEQIVKAWPCPSCGFFQPSMFFCCLVSVSVFRAQPDVSGPVIV